MKSILALAILIMVLFSACKNKTSEDNVNSEPTNNVQTTDTEDTSLYACSMHPEVTGKKGDKCSKCGMELTEKVIDSNVQPTSENTITTETPVVADKEKPSQATKVSISEVVSNYLKLKNALTQDNSKGAASAGKQLLTSLKAISSATVEDKQKKEFLEIIEDAQEHSEHIGANAGKIDHQREHLAMLSKDIADLINMFGAPQKLYQDFCPMYNNGKGATWISESKEIKNPYYGSEMISCGSIKKTY